MMTFSSSVRFPEPMNFSLLYTDNAMGEEGDDRPSRMVTDLEQGCAGLKAALEELSVPDAVPGSGGQLRSVF